jgi:hypothetical protein
MTGLNRLEKNIGFAGGNEMDLSAVIKNSALILLNVGRA